MADPLQTIFDSGELAQDALNLQAGCETALRHALTPLLLAGSAETECMVWALVESLAHFRAAASAEVNRMQVCTFG